MDYIWLVPLFPLLGFLINLFFGRKIGEKGAGIIASSVIGLSFIVTVYLFYQLIQLPAAERTFTKTMFTWIQAGSFNVNIAFLLDPLSVIMMLVVTGVSFLIHIYSTGYMHGDKDVTRYFTYLNLFVFAMLLLIMGDNYLLMFVGWEGVGLCSYLLIGFWFDDINNAIAGKKAFIVNRIGDFGFLVAMFMIFKLFGSLQFNEVFHAAKLNFTVGDGMITIIGLCLFVGACGKSAQIPLYVWLPDAMAGPTPVSALIHAATMVTAGVYMVARSNVLYMLSPAAMMVVAIVGAFTALYAATIGICQTDIKKVLAYSTISQLGYMFIGVGVGAFSAGIFHLMTHAFFKALLFLGAGSVIHAMGGDQEMPNMGGLKKYMPRTYMTMFVACLAIAGIPGFSGFFSKDEILWFAFSGTRGHPVIWLIGALGAGITAFYMFRLLFMTFYGKPRMSEEVKHHLHESPNSMVIPLIILGVLALAGGYVGIPAVLLEHGNSFEHFLHPVFEEGLSLDHAESHPSHTTELIMMAVSVMIALIGIFLAYTFYIRNTEKPAKIASSIKGVYKLVFNKYYIDEVYEAVIVKPIGAISKTFLWKVFDAGIIDGIVNGTAYTTQGISGMLRKIQSGYIQAYAFSIFIGVVFLVTYFILR